MTLLSLEGATARLGRRTVLKAVDLTVAAGEVVALCGPNGAGKSSAIRAAAGLLPLDCGRAMLREADVRMLPHRVRADWVAYLPQERRIAWNLPAIEVVALGAPFLAGGEALERARAALQEVGADALADRGVAEMSGGERARVLLARALASRAPLLLADEPIAGLDPDAQRLVLERLRARAEGGGAVLVSLHDLTLAAEFADRVAVLTAGSKLADGPPTQALGPEVLRRVFSLDGGWIDGPDGPLLAARRAQ